MAIRIDFLSNVRNFLQGTDDVEGALQKVGGSLDGLAAESKTAGTKTASGMTTAADKIEQSFTQMAAEARSQTQSVTRAVQQSESEQTNIVELSSREQRKLKREGLQQVAEQAKLSAASAAADIDGSLGGLANAANSAFTGILLAMPPQFTALGALALGALGLISGAITRDDQGTQAFKQTVSDLTGQLLNAGNTGHRSLSDIDKDLETLAENTDDSKTKLSDLEQVAQTLKVPLRDVVYAYEQGGKPLDELVTKTKRLQDAEAARQRATAAANDPENAGLGSLGHLTSDYNEKLNHVNDTLGKQQDALKGAANAAQLAAQAGLSDYQLKADLLDQLGKAYDDAAGDVSDYLDAESGLLDVGKYIAAMQAKQKALHDYQQNLASSGLSAEAKKFLESQGEDAAAQLLAGYEGASDAQKAELAQIWTNAGVASTGAFNSALNASLPKDVHIPITLDLKNALNTLDQLDKPRTIKVSVSPAGRLAEKLL